MKIKLLLIFSFILTVSCQRISNHKDRDKVFLIQPFENFSSKDIDLVYDVLQDHFNRDVYILPSSKLPESAWYSPRNRYRADSLIRYLRSTAPDICYKIIGLTTQDISTTKGKYMDWGIFGLGFSPGKSCVVSSYRLKKNARENQYRERLRKVALHEIGHTLKLPHCKSKSCVMQDAGGRIATVDHSREEFCPECRAEIY